MDANGDANGGRFIRSLLVIRSRRRSRRPSRAIILSAPGAERPSQGVRCRILLSPPCPRALEAGRPGGESLSGINRANATPQSYLRCHIHPMNRALDRGKETVCPMKGSRVLSFASSIASCRDIDPSLCSLRISENESGDENGGRFLRSSLVIRSRRRSRFPSLPVLLSPLCPRDLEAGRPGGKSLSGANIANASSFPAHLLVGGAVLYFFPL